MSTPDRFHALMRDVARLAAGQELNAGLQAALNREAGPQSALFQEIFDTCRQGVAEGWMCSREGGGIRYGRVIKPAPDLAGCPWTWWTWTTWPARCTRTPTERST